MENPDPAPTLGATDRIKRAFLEIMVEDPQTTRSRIGTRSYWEEMVVPRLQETTMPSEPNPGRRPDTAEPKDQGRWVRSDEARKQLKLSTCDLAHAREAGKIPFKKSGNAYLYRIDGTESPDR